MSPLWWGGVFAATYAVYFLGSLENELVVIELFSLCVTAEALPAKIDWKSAFSKKRSQFGPNFQVQEVVLASYSSCRKTRWMTFCTV